MKKRITIKAKAINATSLMILISLCFLMGTLAGCTGPNHSFDLRKPATLDMNPPEGPQNYQQGWVDGCKSGIASTNTNFQMTFATYTFTLDTKLRYDRLYNQAWRYAYNHCGYSMRSLARYNF